MDFIQLRDIVIKGSLPKCQDLLDRVQLSMQLLVGGEVIGETKQVGNEPTQAVWRLNNTINVVTLATTPSFTITIVQHTADHDNKQLDSITLSRDVILDQSVKQSSGCVKYDLQPYLHSHYPAIIAGLHVQFAAQGNSGASLDQSGFSAFLYVSVIHGSSAISMLHGILAPVINLFRYPIADHEDSHLGVNIILLLLRQMQSSAQSKMQINEDILLMVHERVLLLSNTQENKSQFLNALGDIHLDVYQTSHAVHHLHQAVLVYDQAVQLTSDDNLVKANYLNDLGMALYSCFTQLGGIDDINKSVATLEHALKLIPDHYPDKYALCNNLGRSLYARFGQLGNVGDLDQTMLMYETAVQHTPDNHPNKAASLNNLGILFQRRFEQLGDSIDLNKCIGIYEKALELTPDTHPNKPGIWNNFSGLLLRHAEQTDDMSNIDKSISMLQYAVQNVPNSHLDKSLLLGNLGTSFICRFHHLGNIDDINQSILMLKEAVELSSDGQPSRPSLLSSLGNSLIQCFEYLHKTSDLEQAMFVLKEAVQLTSNSNPDKPVRLNNLSHAYGLYFDWFGDISHLNKSISTIEDALKLMPDNHSKKPFIWSTLGGSLLVRFDQLGDVRDVNQSISILEHAIQITPNGHSDKPTMWSNLGMALLHCFERSGETKDIGYSILALENAIQLAPDGHLSKSQMFSTISNSLLCRFEKLGNSNDIDKSVIMSKNAMDHTADGHPNKPLVLNSLGKSLFCRYKHLHHDSDFKESIAILGEALKITPSQHPFQPTLLSNLGDMHSYNFRQHRNIQDMVSALSYYSMATSSPTGYPFLRFSVAAKWASYANEFPGISHNSVLEAYTVALNVLPQLAWLGLSIKDRQFNLLEVGRVVRNAISTAIEHGQHALALEWMEQGRSVIWGQLLQLRTPVDDLREAHPELAKKLEQLSKQLEVAGTDRLSDSHHIRNQLPPEAVAQHSHDLADERDKLITTIQKLDGFQRFLLPQTISQLLPAASAGSVVTVNVSANRCDVLIIKSDLGIMHIPLEQFTLADAKDLYKSLRVLLAYKGALREAERKGGPAPANHLLKDPDAEFEKILSKLWVGIAKPVLDGLAITTPTLSTNNLPHIWWCLTGPLFFLPIHAAGIYGEKETLGSKLSDFVVSSYTPTLTALLKGSHSRTMQKQKLLMVALPTESGLPGTQKELDKIETCIGDFPVSRLMESNATVENVVKMKECSWVHFACHGVQKISDPTESALLLAGHSQLTLSNIIKLSLPHAELAFLSACQTATGTEDLAEEAVYLAAGMLLAGYHGVIATSWSIMDDDAVQVANDVFIPIFSKIHSPMPLKQLMHYILLLRIFAENQDHSFLGFHLYTLVFDHSILDAACPVLDSTMLFLMKTLWFPMPLILLLLYVLTKKGLSVSVPVLVLTS